MAVLARDCHKLLHASRSFKDLFSSSLVLDIQLAVMAYTWCTCGNVWPVFLSTWAFGLLIWCVSKTLGGNSILPCLATCLATATPHGLSEPYPLVFTAWAGAEDFPWPWMAIDQKGEVLTWLFTGLDCLCCCGLLGHFLVFAFGCCWQKLVTGASHGFCWWPVSLWGQGKSLELGKLNCQMEICSFKAAKDDVLFQWKCLKGKGKILRHSRKAFAEGNM